MRLHLSTAFVVMMIAAVLVGLNIRGQNSVAPEHQHAVKDEKRSMGWPWPYSRTVAVTTVVWTKTGPVSSTKIITRDDGSALVADAIFCLALLVNLGGLYERVARGLKLQG